MSKDFVPLRLYGTGAYEKEYISFEAEASDLLADYDRYQKYVKAIEKNVRNDDRYTAYIAKVKQGGMDHCAIMGNLPTDDPKLKIEMHHGPIFNLFDYCDIVLKASLKRGDTDITTYKIADIILTEHEMDNIMIVMLSKTVHSSVHNRKLWNGPFIDVKATWGKLERFIDHWSDGMEREHWRYIDIYIKECENAKGQTLDQGLFDVADTLKSFAS